MNRKQKEKFGDWLLDVAKYMTTAVIITSLFDSFGSKWALAIGFIAVVVSFYIGISFFADNKKTNRRKGKKK